MNDNPLIIYTTVAFLIVATLAVLIFTIRWIFFPSINRSYSDPGIKLNDEARQAMTDQHQQIRSKPAKDGLLHDVTMSFLVVILSGIYVALLWNKTEIPKFLETALTLILGYYFAEKAIQKK
jgi:hypothetical protein